MSYKIDVSNIICDHVKSLVDDSTGKPGARDWFFFLILPILITFFLVYKDVLISSDTANAVISGLAIYVGLSINFLMIIFELSAKEFFKKSERKEILIQIIANISITVIYSIIIIILALMVNFECIKILVYSILYFFLIQFLITMLMVLKRIYNLLTGIIDLDI